MLETPAELPDPEPLPDRRLNTCPRCYAITGTNPNCFECYRIRHLVTGEKHAHPENP
jgi:hypothetical protein